MENNMLNLAKIANYTLDDPLVGENEVVEFVFFPDYKGVRAIDPWPAKDVACPRCRKSELRGLTDGKFPKKKGVFCDPCTKNMLYWHPTNPNKVCPVCYSKAHTRIKKDSGEAYLNCLRCPAVTLDEQPWHGTEEFIVDDWRTYHADIPNQQPIGTP